MPVLLSSFLKWMKRSNWLGKQRNDFNSFIWRMKKVEMSPIFRYIYVHLSSYLFIKYLNLHLFIRIHSFVAIYLFIIRLFNKQWPSFDKSHWLVLFHCMASQSGLKLLICRRCSNEALFKSLLHASRRLNLG